MARRWTASALALLLVVSVIQVAQGFHWPGHHKHAVRPDRIKTIVLLIMENRSFDHMLGFLKRLNEEIDGLTGEESNLVNATDPHSRKVGVNDHAEFIDPDPGHSFQAIREQVFGGNETWQLNQNPAPMNGFAQQAESMIAGFSHRIMSAFRPEVLPVYSSAAMEFALFDKWFAALPASTQPNRLFIHSATSHGAIANHPEDLVRGFPQKTIYECVEESGLNFGVYFQNVPSVLFLKNMREVRHATKLQPWEMFKVKAWEGRLENLVLLEPRYFDILGKPANDDHPSHDVAEGQRLISEVYRILRKSPQWKEMAFIVTYDEHGGFYDHVPTPVRNVPSPDGIVDDVHGFEFNRLGVRVPTIVISPWINKGTVVHEATGPTPHSHYEHSSIPATIKKLLNLRSDFLTARDRWAGTFEHIFYERDSPRDDCPDVLPAPLWSLRHSPPNEDSELTEWQEELVQLAAELVGDYRLKAGHMTKENGLKMTVWEANAYVETATEVFLAASQQAEANGVDGMQIVNPKPIPIPVREPAEPLASLLKKVRTVASNIFNTFRTTEGEKDI
eukprot:TRINITY_DN5664_c0_g2_i1.p1 TRINITY_DN5664_c0_g2~~TRINITY_DN5664_c0_g2_i1.p1  ORF type:complete len:561 (+),score=79.61 TRINITY_DN5664_c0_g2_i1:132-1814(+)